MGRVASESNDETLSDLILSFLGEGGGHPDVHDTGMHIHTVFSDIDSQKICSHLTCSEVTTLTLTLTLKSRRCCVVISAHFPQKTTKPLCNVSQVQKLDLAAC